MGVALALIGYIVTLISYQNVQQSHLADAWDKDHPSVALASAAGTPIQRAHLADGQSVARLIIPSIKFSAIVTEGADNGILSSGPGHDDRTFYPGEGSVILLSNHNGFSFSWNDIHEGTQVVVDMAYGRYRYTVSKRFIVSGDDTSVLSQPPTGETLVLSTCWPLWQGALAHDRLVFEARPS
jgi:LPXTG-site transpeptidase (sortase) family protein